MSAEDAKRDSSLIAHRSALSGPPGPRHVCLLVLCMQNIAQMCAAIDCTWRDRCAAYCASILDDGLRRLLEHAQNNAHCDQDHAETERLLHHRRRNVLGDRRILEGLVDHVEGEHDDQYP